MHDFLLIVQNGIIMMNLFYVNLFQLNRRDIFYAYYIQKGMNMKAVLLHWGLINGQQ